MNRIISYLEHTFGIQLPEVGYLVGGAVANTLYAIATGTCPRINDIDIYTTPNMDAKCEFNPIVRAGGKVVGRYREEQNGMKIENHLLNGNYDIRTAISDFDINACMAGINLYNGRLYVSPEYARFLKTHVLELMESGKCQDWSIRRMLKKRNDIPGSIIIKGA